MFELPSVGTLGVDSSVPAHTPRQLAIKKKTQNTRKGGTPLCTALHWRHCTARHCTAVDRRHVVSQPPRHSRQVLRALPADLGCRSRMSVAVVARYWRHGPTSVSARRSGRCGKAEGAEVHDLASAWPTGRFRPHIAPTARVCPLCFRPVSV